MSLKGQKRVIDTADLGKWPTIDNVRISSDGSYSAYTLISRETSEVARNLHLVTNSNGFDTAFCDARSLSFTNDDKNALFLQGSDTLRIMNLKSREMSTLPNVKSFLVPEEGNNVRYAYLLQNQRLVVKEGPRGHEQIIDSVNGYFLNKDGQVLIVEIVRGDGSSLYSVDMHSGNRYEIWSGAELGEHRFDEPGRQFAFFGKDAAGTNSLYLFREGMEKAIELVRGDSVLWSDFRLTDRSLQFSNHGDRVLFNIAGPAKRDTVPAKGDENLVVWNYKEPYLPPELAFSFGKSNEYWAVVDIDSKQVIRLNGQEEIWSKGAAFQDWLLFQDPSYAKQYQTSDHYSNVYLVSTTDGSKRQVVRLRPRDLINYRDMMGLSPDEKFVLWFDPDSLCYLSYEVSSGAIKNVSKTVSAVLYDSEAYRMGNAPQLKFGRPAWAKSGHTLFLFDREDIWKVDAGGKARPVNFTNYYGSKHGILLDIVENYDSYPIRVVNNDQKMLLTGFDPITKTNGFWWSAPQSTDPIKCNLENYAFFIGRTNEVGYSEPATGFVPVKAAKAGVYLVERQNAVEYPNVYLTSDFKGFRPITRLHPQSKYNWLSAELLTWRMPDGRQAQGILYKPANFGQYTTRLPLIVDIYEKKTSGLNEFLFPDYTRGRMDIPYYVSNGYLVFTPDIYYEPQHKGKGLVESLESAVAFLGKLPFVDSTRIGLQGHSFGGWEVNYMETHSDRFAAACEGAGVSDEISNYDQILGGYANHQGSYETANQASPYGYGVTPWSRPDLYIENSPVFSVDKATSPLLIVHGGADPAVPFEQAEEMFLAMRRAGKRVWLLQYFKGNHGMFGPDAVDLTGRMKQFFDHYLKGMAEPGWMTTDAKQ